ncbi:hypothetical protein, variant [Cryptococcus amylolentus CBS 6039]|uniref:Zn(2)-C6 fungal-type domain-containing protein n=1 Tax=Cryptococcus amylolentus CBS 6039 TaxID=1295533 RepID=A0A1E3HSJ2_9TREE|nr:hypothetical protein, variant [Cryptococcus amylolentus CBS 6039]ODN79329.1 hypothetical protein, variant [Cryptococcus amylolentus CBS 6039]
MSSINKEGSTEPPVELTSTGRPKRKRVRTVTGCRTCRARRVKCDEQRPKCGNCLRHPLRVCEYEFGVPESERTRTASPQRQGTANLHSVASSSRVTLDPKTDESCPAPVITPQYEEYLMRSQVSRAMAREISELHLLQPMRDTALLAESLITKLPSSAFIDFSSLLQFHTSLVRRCSSALADDPQARLLCAATALLTSSSSPSYTTPPSYSNTTSSYSAPSSPAGSHRPNIFPFYTQLLKSKTDSTITGKLAGAGFTLLLSEALDPARPGMWREHVGVLVGRSKERGGPGRSLGLGQNGAGFGRGGYGERLDNLQPLAFAFYAEMAAVAELYACLTDGTTPFLLGPHSFETVPWLIASRSAQMRASKDIPDTIETMFGTPRILMLAFARAIGLVAKVGAAAGGAEGVEGEGEMGEMEREQLDFEVLAFRSELEHVWPGRLEGRRDTRRVYYGGRIWRLAILILVMSKTQHVPLFSPDLIAQVSTVYELLSEAVTEIGHLTGWLWPLLITACACTDPVQRQGFVGFLRHAKGPIGDRDNLEVAHRVCPSLPPPSSLLNPEWNKRMMKRLMLG